MQTDQIVRCPNCGSAAERHYFTSYDPTYAQCLGHRGTQTKCPVCDYLMLMCPLTGNVLESYSPANLFKYRTFDQLRNIGSIVNLERTWIAIQ
jgi:hypothetical protein